MTQVYLSRVEEFLDGLVELCRECNSLTESAGRDLYERELTQIATHLDLARNHLIRIRSVVASVPRGS